MATEYDDTAADSDGLPAGAGGQAGAHRQAGGRQRQRAAAGRQQAGEDAREDAQGMREPTEGPRGYQNVGIGIVGIPTYRHLVTTASSSSNHFETKLRVTRSTLDSKTLHWAKAVVTECR